MTAGTKITVTPIAAYQPLSNDDNKSFEVSVVISDAAPDGLFAAEALRVLTEAIKLAVSKGYIEGDEPANFAFVFTFTQTEVEDGVLVPDSKRSTSRPKLDG